MSQTKAQLLDGSVVAVSFGAGSAAAPSINYSADTTTGIYFPGSGQLAISTSGSGRLIVNSTGQISIPHTVTSLTTTIAINNTDSTNGTGNRIALQSNGTNVAAFDWDYTGSVFSTNISSYGGIVFKTNGASPTEKMRIDSSGNVGIGMSPSAWGANFKGLQIAPWTSLHANNNNGSLGLSVNSYIAGSGGGSPTYIGTGTATSYVQNAGAHYWYTAPSGTAGNTITFTQAMTLDASGRLGLGATGPLQALQVAGKAIIGLTGQDAPAASVLHLYQASGSNGISWGDSSFSPAAYIGTSAGALNFSARVNGSTAANPASPQMTLVDGRLGINTASPSFKLQVAGGNATNFGVSGGSTAIRFDFDSTQSTIFGVDNTFFGYYTPLRIGGSITQFLIGGNEAGRFDSSNRLLIGTSTARTNLYGASYDPTFQLETSAGLAERGLSICYNGGTTTGGSLIALITSRGTTAGAVTIVASGDELGGINFMGTDGVKPLAGATISSYVDGTPGLNSMPGRLVFSTTPSGSASPAEAMRISSNRVITSTLAGSTNQPNIVLSVGGVGDPGTTSWVTPRIDFQGSSLASPGTTFIGATGAIGSRALIFATGGDAAGTERMRIVSDGSILIGTTGAGVVNNNGITLNPNGNYSTFNHVNGTVTGTGYIVFGYNGSLIGSITQNGTTAVAYNTSSDYRLKENIVLLTGAIDRLQQIPVHRFNFITEPDKTVDGFLAHEAQAVVPECVTGEKDAVDEDGNPIYQGIDQSKLVPLLTAALQEAIAKIEALETRLAALEGK